MALQPSPSQAQIQTALRAVLLGILPSGIEVIQGQDNLSVEPQSPDFVVMTMLRRERISTNIDTYADCKLVGSIAGTTLTVISVAFGALIVGRTLFGTGAATDPTIVSLAPGGTATLSQSLTVSARPLAAGAKVIKQATRIVYQLDIHGASMSTASDNAQTISTVFRDDTGVQLLKATGVPVSPLYADDPKQIPFENAEGQTESRYVVECHLQADQVLTPPQEFADSVEIDRVAADLFYAAG